MVDRIKLSHLWRHSSHRLNDYPAEKTKNKIVLLNTKTISQEKGYPPSKPAVLFSGNENRDALGVKNRINQSEGEMRSLLDILKFREQVIDIARVALNKPESHLDELKKTFNLPEISEVNSNRPATHKEIYAARKIENRVIENIAKNLASQNNISLSEARQPAVDIYKQTRVNHLNNQPWALLKKSFTHNNNEYISTHRPAAEMKKGAHDIFPVSYNGKGVCCWDINNTQHATNLWNSRVSVKTQDGQVKELFSGIRHGVLSPYGVENRQQRHAGAVNRAKEVVSAALFSKPDLLERALSGEVVPLRLVSASLLTPTGLFGKEDKMLHDQMQAWQALTKSSSPLSLDIKDTNGNLRQIKIALEVSPFNFGVNELALKFGLGNESSDKYNLPALQQLLGKDLRPDAESSGWVGEYLAKRPENAETVKELSRQIKHIWQKKTHHRDGGEPYKLAQRITMLANEINSVPCWNCKSGKDRTGMLDAEIKREAISLHQGMPLNKPGLPLDQKGKWLMQKVLLDGGNLEVQAQNTGLTGNKVIKSLGLSWLNLSYKERISDNQTWLKTQGMAKFVVS